jgi:hypothetical protein
MNADLSFKETLGDVPSSDLHYNMVNIAMDLLVHRHLMAVTSQTSRRPEAVSEGGP